MALYGRFSREDGTLVEQKDQPRGRPPVGFVKIDKEGNPLSPEDLEKVKANISKTPPATVAEVPKKERKNQKEPKVECLYVKYDGDRIIHVKEVTRGRPPIGYSRVPKDQVPSDKYPDSSIDDIAEKPATTVEDILQDDEVEETQSSIVHSHDVPNTTVIESGTTDKTKVVQHTKQIECCDLRNNYLKVAQTEQEDDGIVKMLAVMVVGKAEEVVDELMLGTVHARVDINKNNGNLSIWNSTVDGPPDIIVEGAVVNTEKPIPAS